MLMFLFHVSILLMFTCNCPSLWMFVYYKWLDKDNIVSLFFIWAAIPPSVPASAKAESSTQVGLQSRTTVFIYQYHWRLSPKEQPPSVVKERR